MRVEGDTRYAKWTAEEERRLLELRAAGRSAGEIAKLLSRTSASVSSRLTRLTRTSVAG